MDDTTKFDKLQIKLKEFQKLLTEIQALYVPLCSGEGEMLCSSENAALKCIRDYVDAESRRVAKMVEEYVEYETSSKKLTEEFRTLLKDHVRGVNDGFSALDHQLTTLNDCLLSVDDASREFVTEVEDQLGSGSSSRRGSYELSRRCSQSSSQTTTEEDEDEIFLDCDDDSQELVKRYVNGEAIDYTSLSEGERERLLDDLETLHLPFRRELGVLFKHDDTNELYAWKFRYVQVNGHYYEYFNNYIRINGMLEKWYRESFVKDMDYDATLGRFFICKEIKSIEVIDNYVMDNHLDLDLVKAKCTNGDTLIHDFQYCGIELAPKEIESIANILAVPIESSTLLTPTTLSTLKAWCGENKKWKLLYSGTRNGDSAADFHHYCDDKDETIVLVKAHNKDNIVCIFGGYTTRSWKEDIGCERNADFKFDNYSFLFTLENPYQIPPTQLVLNNKKYAILCNNKYGPVFGDNELYISDHFLSNAESFVHLGFTYCSETYKSFSLFINTDDNSEYKHFKVDELEVYGL